MLMGVVPTIAFTIATTQPGGDHSPGFGRGLYSAPDGGLPYCIPVACAPSILAKGIRQPKCLCNSAALGLCSCFLIHFSMQFFCALLHTFNFFRQLALFLLSGMLQPPLIPDFSVVEITHLVLHLHQPFLCISPFLTALISRCRLSRLYLQDIMVDGGIRLSSLLSLLLYNIIYSGVKANSPSSNCVFLCVSYRSVSYGFTLCSSSDRVSLPASGDTGLNA